MTWIEDAKERTKHITTPRNLWDSGDCWEKDVRKLIKALEISMEGLKSMGATSMIKSIEELGDD